MAKRQTDETTESIEELLEKANRANLAKLEEEKKRPEFTPIDLTDDELRTLAIKKLSAALQAIDPVLQPEMTRKLAAEVKDRLDGKPGQQIQIDQNLNVVTVNAKVTFVKPLPLIDVTPPNNKDQ